MSKFLTFNAIQAKQSDKHQVFSFAASASKIFKMASIDRVGRDDVGDLFGFQRPQITRHIEEIGDYLRLEDSVLPNSVVLAFTDGVEFHEANNGTTELKVDISKGPVGVIVDGQQRLSALQMLPERDFEVFVSVILCENDDELRRQFILINNTRPLPKELIYELLPTVHGLPQRLASRAFAANITSKLNYYCCPDDPDNYMALKGAIKQHTNPTGSLSSTAMQKVIMNSRSNGALREFAMMEDSEERSVKLISDFYCAVCDVFPASWIGHGPRQSRLKHSIGIIAMGYAMEVLYSIHGARTRQEFAEKLSCMTEEGACAWTSGIWYFTEQEMRPWDRIQNTSSDIRLLSDYIVRLARDQGIREGGVLDKARKAFQSEKSHIN